MFCWTMYMYIMSFMDEPCYVLRLLSSKSAIRSVPKVVIRVLDDTWVV